MCDEVEIIKIYWKVEGLNPEEVTQGYKDWVDSLAKALSTHIRTVLEGGGDGRF